MNGKTQWAMIAVLVGMMTGTGAGASPEPGAAPKEAPAAAKKVLTVKRGEAKRLDEPGLTRVAVGDPSIADVNAVGSSLLEVKGVSEGKTTVLLWTKDGQQRAYEIHVKK